jgi:DNA-directed RNA polymerase specialized sigma subunit
MHVSWTFLDKRSATINAIRAYNDMEVIIENTPDKIREKETLKLSPTTAQLSNMPPLLPDPKRGEARLVAIIDGISNMYERYRQAKEYMAWFNPAWNALEDIERTILTEIYQSSSMRSGASVRLEAKLNYSRSQVDRMRSKAVMRLSRLLFGV